MTQPLRSLRSPTYLRLLASTLVTYGARFLDITIMSWLVAQRVDDPLPVALLGFFRFAPCMVLGPAMGFIADSFPRLRVVRVAQIGLASIAAAMASLLATGVLELWHIYLYALGQGLVFMLDSTSRRSYLAGTVGNHNITAALSIDMLGMTVQRILFANAGGALLTALNPRWAYVGLAGMAMLSAALTLGLPRLYRSRGDAPREPLLASLKGGLAFARANRVVMGGLLLVALSNLTAFSYEALIPAVADQIFRATPIEFGWFMSATGAGSLCTGVWLSLRGVRFPRPGLSALIASAGLHVLQIAFSFADELWLSLLALAAIGAVGTVFSISHSSLFLTAAPDHLRGRILGLQVVVIGTFPLSSLLTGWLGNLYGPLEAVRYMALAGSIWVILLAWFVPELRGPVEEIAEDLEDEPIMNRERKA